MDSKRNEHTEALPRERIAVLGSTGSIGTQTLDVIARYPDRFRASVLIAGSKVDTLIQQAMRFRPDLAVIADESKLWKLRDALSPLGIAVTAGDEAVTDAMSTDLFDTVVTATVGYSGLRPTLRAIDAGKRIALANKETLVVAGDLVTRRAREKGVEILPVDSEHSAIYQCLAGERPETVRRLILTASGGPFRTFTSERLAQVRASDALKHPNWSMGAKITVDSATLMNKAFEIIEAKWLFNVKPQQITAVVHPESIVHSMVEFTDGSVKAQLGLPDMRIPISYALSATSRIESTAEPLTLDRYARLTFEAPRADLFPAINLGHYALERAGNTACIINAANEVAVARFLRDEIPFDAIYRSITETLAKVPFIAEPSYEDYVGTNAMARTIASEITDAIISKTIH